MIRSRNNRSLTIAGRSYRDVELSPSHPLSRMLAVDRRDRHVHHLPVKALTLEETCELATALAPSADLRPWGEVIWRETSGNPFLAELELRIRHDRVPEYAAELAAQSHASATLPGADRGIEFALLAAK